ncbi:cytochrome P450 2J2-like [Pomacea canaliculata]|uniref:cytochrome P450 2J2-like n=1 Tax=Pomacea canaliculata TaxID=400727 RepID=UPI000D73D5A0|nr:cytochrome P450 2J2-like [Pomacea canaliculata]
MVANILAEKIQEEVQECVKALAEKKGQPLDLTRMTQVTVSNNICSIVFGKRFEYEDPFFKRYRSSCRRNPQRRRVNVSSEEYSQFYDLCQGILSGCRKLYEDVSTVLNTLVKPFIDRHVEEYNEDSVDDFISAYIKEVGKNVFGM